MVFQSCMEFRRNTLAEIGPSEKCPVFEHLDDIVNKTLCVKPEDKSYHSRECLNRECESCGVEKLDLLKEEEDVSLQAPKVSWQKFEYVGCWPNPRGAREKETPTSQKRNFSRCYVQQLQKAAA